MLDMDDQLVEISHDNDEVYSPWQAVQYIQYIKKLMK